jgi:hypothetical protein
VHIQSRANSNDVNRMIALVMIAMMIVLVMVHIVPEALNQVDSVCQHSSQTFQRLIDLHRPNASRRKLNSLLCFPGKNDLTRRVTHREAVFGPVIHSIFDAWHYESLWTCNLTRLL